jgi:hypothetical protein
VSESDDDNTPCAACDGKVSHLDLRYDGITAATIRVTDRKNETTLFNQTVTAGGVFTLNGFDKQGTLGTEIVIRINGVENARIHTSCSVPIGLGQVYGAFTIVDGESRNGGQLCEIGSTDGENACHEHDDRDDDRNHDYESHDRNGGKDYDAKDSDKDNDKKSDDKKDSYNNKDKNDSHDSKDDDKKNDKKDSGKKDNKKK